MAWVHRKSVDTKASRARPVRFTGQRTAASSRSAALVWVCAGKREGGGSRVSQPAVPEECGEASVSTLLRAVSVVASVGRRWPSWLTDGPTSCRRPAPPTHAHKPPRGPKSTRAHHKVQRATERGAGAQRLGRKPPGKGGPAHATLTGTVCDMRARTPNKTQPRVARGASLRLAEIGGGHTHRVDRPGPAVEGLPVVRPGPTIAVVVAGEGGGRRKLVHQPLRLAAEQLGNVHAVRHVAGAWVVGGGTAAAALQQPYVCGVGAVGLHVRHATVQGEGPRGGQLHLATGHRDPAAVPWW